MIELKKDRLEFSFTEVHPQACFSIEFQRTLRIPDDGTDYPLPPGLGRFPLKHVDDFAETVSNAWLSHGGVMLPMYQSEAMWLNFDSSYISERQTAYPFAVKVATGKICAVSGESWSNGLSSRPQNYLVVPRQPWLDGYCVEKGIIRQFVAMPLGTGYTAEEQLTGAADVGGLQIVAYPMRREVFERRFPKLAEERYILRARMCKADCLDAGMGLAPGGRMRQEINADPFDIRDWDQSASSRCFVHIANSLVWQSITGSAPPSPPPTSKQYAKAGLPWFEYYGETKALDGAKKLVGLTSIAALGKQKGDVPLPENESIDPAHIVKLRPKLKPNQVREEVF